MQVPVVNEDYPISFSGDLVIKFPVRDFQISASHRALRGMTVLIFLIGDGKSG
jgi:hypothetical protein